MTHKKTTFPVQMINGKNTIKSIMRSSLINLFLLLICSVGYSQTPIYLTDTFQSFDLQFSTISILEDPSHDLRFEEIENSDQFVENQERTPNFGFTKSVYWLKLHLINYSDYEQWVIKIKYALINKVTLYMRDKDGTVKVIHQGIIQSTNNQTTYRYPIFTPFFKKQKAFHIYLRVEPGNTLQIPIEISNINKFIETTSIEERFFGIYYGALCLIIAFAFRMFFVLRDFDFLRFCLFVLTYGSMMLFFDGSEHTFFDFGYQQKILNDYIFVVVTALNAFFSVWFTTYLLKRSQLSKTILWISYSIMAIVVLQNITLSLLPYNTWLQANVIVFILCYFYNWVISIQSWVKREEDGQMICIAFSTLIIASIITALIGFDFLNNHLIFQYTLHVGSLACFFTLTGFFFKKIKKIQEEEKDAEQKSLLEHKKRAALNDTFEKFVPKKLLERINENNVDIHLGEAQQDYISIIFSDIRDFTQTSERLAPKELLTFLNFYFERCSRVINKHGGVIDKYIGDALLALFDFAHRTDTEEATQALAAAIAMQKKVFKYNQKFHKRYSLNLNIGIGIHSGSVIMGTVGSKMRMDTTILGNTVNIASRLEELTKFYQTPILLSEDTYNLLKFPEYARYIDNVTLPGRIEPVKIFEGLTHDEDIEKFQSISVDYRNAIFLYNDQQWERATDVFKKCQQLCPQDHIIELYLQRCEQQMNQPSDQ